MKNKNNVRIKCLFYAPHPDNGMVDSVNSGGGLASIFEIHVREKLRDLFNIENIEFHSEFGYPKRDDLFIVLSDPDSIRTKNSLIETMNYFSGPGAIPNQQGYSFTLTQAKEKDRDFNLLIQDAQKTFDS